jgi:hypothetical protein
MHLAQSHEAPSAAPTQPSGYEAGRCNIGPQEVARRRMTGHLGLAITAVLFLILAWTDAPVWMRLVLFLPAAVGAAGYLQAYLRFCADYGWRGVFNFGQAGHHRTTTVTDEAAMRADRRRAAVIGLSSAAIGSAVVLLGLLV